VAMALAHRSHAERLREGGRASRVYRYLQWDGDQEGGAEED